MCVDVMNFFFSLLKVFKRPIFSVCGSATSIGCFVLTLLFHILGLYSFPLFLLYHTGVEM